MALFADEFGECSRTNLPRKLMRTCHTLWLAIVGLMEHCLQH